MLSGLTDKFSGAMRATDDAPMTVNAAPHGVRWNALLGGSPSGNLRATV
jgi:hypothetical protein